MISSRLTVIELLTRRIWATDLSVDIELDDVWVVGKNLKNINLDATDGAHRYTILRLLIPITKVHECRKPCGLVNWKNPAVVCIWLCGTVITYTTTMRVWRLAHPLISYASECNPTCAVTIVSRNLIAHDNRFPRKARWISHTARRPTTCTLLSDTHYVWRTRALFEKKKNSMSSDRLHSTVVDDVRVKTANVRVLRSCTPVSCTHSPCLYNDI